ncbi:SMI1/KNR4 family protein [Flavobacterium sp. ST-75]|uniref:SMI1/KNR4 family protein n=1 Tax=Flavobacterium rhizophilum TaxID=3163296 RepID=A0ABW8YDB2_9FLAO
MKNSGITTSYFLEYNNNLKKTQWNDITFFPIESYALSGKELLDSDTKPGTSEILEFRDNLIQVFSMQVEQKVERLFLIAPKEISGIYYGFLFLQNKQILPIKIVGSPLFYKWMEIVLRDDYEDRDMQSLLQFASNEYSIISIGGSIKMNNRIFNETGKYLFDNAPKKYNEAKLAKEKANYMTKYYQPESHVDTTAIKTAFDQMMKQFNPAFAPPADNEEVYEEFEKTAGFAFPKALQELLKLHDGIEDIPFLTAENILEEWINWKTIYDGWTLGELKKSPDRKKKVLGLYVTPYWVPFFDLEDGNFMAMDFAPDKNGTPGQIIAFGADYEKGEWIADNLAAFLDTFKIDYDDDNEDYDY